MSTTEEDVYQKDWRSRMNHAERICIYRHITSKFCSKMSCPFLSFSHFFFFFVALLYYFNPNIPIILTNLFLFHSFSPNHFHFFMERFYACCTRILLFSLPDKFIYFIIIRFGKNNWNSVFMHLKLKLIAIYDLFLTFWNDCQSFRNNIEKRLESHRSDMKQNEKQLQPQRRSQFQSKRQPHQAVTFP